MAFLPLFSSVFLRPRKGLSLLDTVHSQSDRLSMIQSARSLKLRRGTRCRRSTGQVQPLGDCINLSRVGFLLHISSLAACRGAAAAISISRTRNHFVALTVGLRALWGRPAAAGLGASGFGGPSNNALSGSVLPATSTQSELSEGFSESSAATTAALPMLPLPPGHRASKMLQLFPVDFRAMHPNSSL